MKRANVATWENYFALSIELHHWLSSGSRTRTRNLSINDNPDLSARINHKKVFSD